MPSYPYNLCSIIYLETKEGTRETFYEDNFVVDDNGNSIKRRKVVVAVAANATSNLDATNIETASQLFSADVTQQPLPKPKLPEYEERTDEESILNGEDFERDCDRGIINPNITEEQIYEEAVWICNKHFSTRGGIEEDVAAVEAILNELHRQSHTPQFIINYRIYKL